MNRLIIDLCVDWLHFI